MTGWWTPSWPSGNPGTAITDAPVVLALGPGFTAGVDCHGVVGDHAGPRPGRASSPWERRAQHRRARRRGGYTTQRIIRVPADGR
ncbi:MAG: hypothetical protein ACLRWQ_01520 [Flavonifractor plautii]